MINSFLDWCAVGFQCFVPYQIPKNLQFNKLDLQSLQLFDRCSFPREWLTLTIFLANGSNSPGYLNIGKWQLLIEPQSDLKRNITAIFKQSHPSFMDSVKK